MPGARMRRARRGEAGAARARQGEERRRWRARALPGGSHSAAASEVAGGVHLVGGQVEVTDHGGEDRGSTRRRVSDGG